MIVRETNCAIQWIVIYPLDALSTRFEQLGPELENDRRTVETQFLFFNVNFYSENRLTTIDYYSVQLLCFPAFIFRHRYIVKGIRGPKSVSFLHSPLRTDWVYNQTVWSLALFSLATSPFSSMLLTRWIRAAWIRVAVLNERT